MDQNEIAAVQPDDLSHRSSGIRAYEYDASSSHYQAQMAEEEQFISPTFLLRVLGQWWYIALPTSIVLAVVSAALVMLSFKPEFRSTATLQIASFRPYIAYANDEQTADPEEFIETQIELIRSKLVMEQLLAYDDIAQLPELVAEERPVSWLKNAVSVTQVGSSGLYSVHFDGPNPKNAALLVNAVLDEYFAIRLKDEESKTKRVLELLSVERKQREKVITELREKLRTLGADVYGVDPTTGLPQQGATTPTPLSELSIRRVKAEVESKVLEAQITALEETVDSGKVPVPESQIEMSITDSLEVQNLRRMIADKKIMLAEVETAAAQGKDDPSYRRIERGIEQLERRLAAAATKSRPMIKEQLKATAALESKDMLTQLKAQLDANRIVEKLLVEKYNEQVTEAGKSGNKLLELEFTRSELAREEKVFDTIAERAMALSTESRAPGRVTLLQQGEPPTGPIETIPLRNLAAVILASGCLPFGLALLWELSVKRIANADQLSQHAALPVVGEVAKLPMRFQTIGPGGSRAMNLFEESIDSLRVGLVLPDQYKDVKVIAVTSAIHGEGKSSISSQLAVSIGRSVDGNVLLIDGDLRAPDVHRIFNISNDTGLASVLNGKATLDEAINTDFSEFVHLLPAGRLRTSPHKLLSLDVLENILGDLRARYRYIIIDTPPILSASEALMLAKIADGTVLSTRRNVSREAQVRTAHSRLLKAGARPLGAVFNGVPTRSYLHTYGSYDYIRNFE